MTSIKLGGRLHQLTLIKASGNFPSRAWRIISFKSDGKTAPRRAQFKAQLKEIDDKLDRLLDTHLGGAVNIGEYLAKKETLLKEKVDVEEALAKLEAEGAVSRLEQCDTFLKEAHSADQLVASENLEAKRDFLKKVGWNFHLESRRLQFEYENPWGLLSGGETNCSNLGGLPGETSVKNPLKFPGTMESLKVFSSNDSKVTSSEGGRSSVFSAPAAAPAAAIFRKSRTIEQMRPRWTATRTVFQEIYRRHGAT